MKLVPFKNKGLAFITTNACTALCAHCMMCCTPGDRQALSADEMIRVIYEAKKNYDIDLVVFKTQIVRRCRRYKYIIYARVCAR